MAPHAIQPVANSSPNLEPNPSKLFYGKDVLDSVAIIGFSIGFPQNVNDSDALWKLMMEKRSTDTEFPESRMNADSMYHPDANRRGQVPVKRSHFLEEDLTRFDSAFFNTSSTDAACMDPQQRLLLEHSYRALENAGLPMENVSGSKTSVYTGCFCTDFKHLCYKDGEQCSTTTALGVQPCLNANRVSWFFGLTGNSANIDTACSSSLVALDIGCKGLLAGDEDMSIVAGSNVILSPDSLHALTNLNMLSPDGQCYSFDHRGNGYSRSEGVGVLILKRVSDAIRANDTIRGVIRSTGCNQAGSTPSITLPSSTAQERLIRESYSRAGLSMEPTRFFEAHGTGTSVGDPIEAKALGSAFRQVRSVKDPLIVGAIKSNVGHLEGASGIAGVIKALIILERGIIPPNTNFERINPKIDTEFLRIKFPLEAMPWPSEGLRRASVNSFGNAGTNSHVVLDDVYHFLHNRNLNASHVTIKNPPYSGPTKQAPNGCASLTQAQLQVSSNTMKGFRPQLLIFSANDEAGIRRQIDGYASHYLKLDFAPGEFEEHLCNLAYTLFCRRSSLAWKSHAVVQSIEDLCRLGQIISPAKKSLSKPGIGLVFTGQGAQWVGMAQELIVLPPFRQSLFESEAELLQLGCSWRLSEEICDTPSSRVHLPEVAQPACTAIQIALVSVLRTLGLQLTAVIGHSSGEIAAAFSTGALSAASAIKLAYYRGVGSALMAESSGRSGGMLSVGLSEAAIQPYIEQVVKRFEYSDLTVACINSPKNVTVAGEEDQLDNLQALVQASGLFARRLHINIAYHSPHMQKVAQSYQEKISFLEHGSPSKTPVHMFSSVTGERVSNAELSQSQYWIRNMLQPVKFSQAMTQLLAHTTSKTRHKLDLSHRDRFRVDMLVEVGPHSALRGPLKDILASALGATQMPYTSLLTRNTPALDSLLDALGHLSCLGCPLDIDLLHRMEIGEREQVTLHNLPGYVFEHSKLHWDESRLSERYRTQSVRKLDLLGKPVLDWNPLEPQWRNYLRISEMPWLEDHVINRSMIYPGAGMIVMVIEAVNQLSASEPDVEGFELRDVAFVKPLQISQDVNGTETRLSLNLAAEDLKRPVSAWSKFRIFSHENAAWTECCHEQVRVSYRSHINSVRSDQDHCVRLEKFINVDAKATSACDIIIDVRTMYDSMIKGGLALGPAFQCVQTAACSAQQEVHGRIKPFEWPADEFPQPHIVHPSSLDALFHLAIAGVSQGGQKTIPTMIPTFLRSFFVSKDGLSFPEAQELYESTWVASESTLETVFNGVTLDSSKTKPVMEFESLVITAIGGSKQQTLEDPLKPADLAYHVSFKPDVDLLERDSIESYCQNNGNLSSTSAFISFIGLLAHKNPDLHILEIDTGNVQLSKEILQTLSILDADDNIIQTKYGKYKFVGQSDINLKKAQDILQLYPRVTYEIHDLERDSFGGFEIVDKYDLVLIPRQTSFTEETSESIRKIMKPRGRLLVSDDEQCRDLSGFTCTKLSNTAMLSSGFNSSSLRINCDSIEGNKTGSVIEIYDTIPSISDTPTDRRLYIVVDKISYRQMHLSTQLTEALRSDSLFEIDTIDLERAGQLADKAESVFVILLEHDSPFVSSLSRKSFQDLQNLLTRASDIIWMSRSGQPESSLFQGLARALRAERQDLRCTVISFEHQDGLSSRQIHQFIQIIQQNHLTQVTEDHDVEYVELTGQLNISRVIFAKHETRKIQKMSQDRYSSSIPIRVAPPLRLEVGSPGMINSLHFVEDNAVSRPLEDNEVEVQTHAIGMNFRDCLSVLGQVSSTILGREFSGIVTRVGTGGFLKPGDRVVAGAAGAFKTINISKAEEVFKIPDEIDFATAAAIPVQFGTAWIVIHRLAKLQQGESVLIHAAAGGTGQAAIQIARLQGATIFATVGSIEKKQLLIKEYNIPESNIFYSRNTDFAQGIRRLTHGRGVDVIINCLAGESLFASWACIAPFGRFVEIGLRDIMSNAQLPMFPFHKSVSFIAFDGTMWAQEKPHEVRIEMEKVIRLFAEKTLHAPKSVHKYDLGDVKKAFQNLKEGIIIGKHIVEVTPESQVEAVLDTQPSFQLDLHATYVIAGGLGGLGRSTARWLADRGARNLVLLSRFGPRTDAAKGLIEELNEQEVRVETPACDITDLQVVDHVFRRLSHEMPPIKGCFQMSILDADCLFENMEFDDWHNAVHCKSTGSWNLHTTLPRGLDFFVLVSSISGLAGIRGQSNYDAGNCYEDALARVRVSMGEKAITLDLGALQDDGILAEDPDLLNRVLKYGILEPITRQKFFAILDYCCNPALPLLLPDQSQLAVGLGMGGGDGLESVDYSRQPLLRPIDLEGSRQKLMISSSTAMSSKDINTRALFAASTSLEKAAEVVLQATVRKLGQSLSSLDSVDVSSIDIHKPLQGYGVDSLLAIELRNWIVKEFVADIAVFETQGASTLSTLSMLVTARSMLEHGAWMT